MEKTNKLILKASAGTGKTYRMSLEYLYAMYRGVSWKEILVMTFTKKATAEIKSRILEFLEAILSRSEKGKGIIRDIEKNHEDFVVDENFQPRMTAIRDEMIKNKDNLRIYTIDSFSNWLFQDAIAKYKNISAFETIDDDENELLLQSVLEKLLKQNYKEVGRFLSLGPEKTSGNYISALKRLINERWKWIMMERELAERGLKTPEREKIPTDLYGKLSLLMESINGLLAKRNLSFEDKYKANDQDKKKCMDLYQANAPREDIERFIVDRCDALTDGNFWNGQTLKKRADSPLCEITEASERFKKEVSKAVFNEKIIPLEQSIFTFIQRVYTYYDEIKFKERKFTFNDISTYTFKFLYDKDLHFIENERLTDDFFDIIGGKITAIFIDEFQDTSILQWQVLSKLVDACPDVLCVGDEKQSIYGWRGGEKKLFENLPDMVGAMVQNLDTCFRSEKNITEYCNRFFSEIAKREDLGELFEIPDRKLAWRFIDSLCKSPDPKKENRGYISVIIGENKPEPDSPAAEMNAPKDSGESSEEAGTEEPFKAPKGDGFVKLVRHIEENFIKKGKSRRGIGVLARYSNDLKAIAQLLKLKKIPYVIEASSNIRRNPSVGAVYDLLKFCYRNSFVSLLNFLSHEPFGCTNEDLQALIDAKPLIMRSFFEEKGITSPVFPDLLPLIREIRDEFFRKKAQARAIIEKIITSFSLVTETTPAVDIENLSRFCELAESYPDIRDFLDELDRKPDDPVFADILFKESDVVTLATVHKAKGLAYDTVYYYYHNRKSPPESGQALRFYAKLDASFTKVRKTILTMKKFLPWLERLEEYRDLILDEKEAEATEKINILYVALTRAVDNLIIVAEDDQKPNPKKGVGDLTGITGLIRQTLEKLSDFESDSELYAPLSEVKAEEKRSVALNLQNQRFSKSEKVSREPAPGLDRLKSHDLAFDDTKRLRGLMIHEFFEHLRRPEAAEIASAARFVRAKYADSLGPVTIDETLSEQNIRALTEKAKTCGLFGDWDRDFSEYALYDKDGRKNILDRLLVRFPKDGKPGEILILDFKTGRSYREEDDDDEKQKIRYVKLIRGQLENSPAGNVYSDRIRFEYVEL
ncbi:MAG: UvrD-helicase domain-containing protein [Fusobacteriaceae bacterium]|jgi:ATP-dependent exoDNAse (exonuclease V) beta subunit|nr:UvrD-helicase domain-containing protein [Fusobacteriaceae bacterium]